MAKKSIKPTATAEAKDSPKRNTRGQFAARKPTVARRTVAMGEFQEPDVDARALEGNASQATKEQPDLSQLSPKQRRELGAIFKPNGAGVTYVEGTDDCFHCNPGWRNGCCTKQGNQPCQFLGGNQALCKLYTSKGPVDKLRKGARGSEKYRTPEGV